MTEKQTSAPASKYPIVGKIVADVQLEDDGRCAMPDARLRYWAKVLRARFPPGKHPILYQMLGGMMAEFAKRQAFASIQLLALATLDLSVDQAARVAGKDAFLTSEESKEALVAVKKDLGTDPASGMKAPSPGGFSLRKKR